MPKTPPHTPRHALLLGYLSIIPLLVWWLGFFPGLMSSDSIDQWNQVLTFDFHNAHPITHTATMWVVSIMWESPGAVALVQVLLMAILLGFVAKRLVQIGVGFWTAVVAVWVIALLPMTSATTITLWKDIPFALAMGWVFTELVLMAVDRVRYWSGLSGPVRLGAALGTMAAMRANGKYTVALFIVVTIVVYRHHIRQLVGLGVAAAAVGLVLPTVLVTVLPVTNQPIEPAQVFMPDVAAVISHSPGSLSSSDLDLARAVAPLTVWNSRYDCGDSSPLLFDVRYNNRQIQENPWEYRGLVVRSFLGAPATVIGHRWCAGEYLLSPVNRTDTFVHRPPFDIWPNTIGLARDPISDRAFATSSWLYVQAERSSIEWLTWRPAIFMLAGIATFVGIWIRRRLSPLRLIPALFAIHLANVFATSPSHEFRYAFGLYLLALFSLPLWSLILDPDRAKIAPVQESGPPVRRAVPAGNEA